MIFKRKIYQKLLEWKNNDKGRSALLIEGARRVGKSTIAEEFAKNEYRSYILIDFSKAGQNIIDLFLDISDLDFLFSQLQLYFQTRLYRRESLIIFDEVQFCPKARQAIKHLVKDNRFDYIETGSLISIKKNVKDILIPSEERKIKMHPMDYEEFLWALNEKEDAFSLLKEPYLKLKGFGDSLNRTSMKRFRLYMLVGGMPQAVNKYIETNNFYEVDKAKREIIDLYIDDLNKIDPTNRLSLIYRSLPSQLMNNASSFQINKIIDSYDISVNSILEHISKLNSSCIVNISYKVNDPKVLLSLTLDLTKFKIFSNDTGLFITLVFYDKDFNSNDLYEKLLADKLSVNLGYIFENMVAQILTSLNEKLFYYVYFDEKAKRNYEIDFLISKNNKVCPIEVKSGDYKIHKSLDYFIKKYSSNIDKKYVIHTKDIKKENDIIYLPIYLTYFINE